VGLAAVAVGWSVPLDDWWLSIASGQAILSGADASRALSFTFTPMQPDVINPQWGAQLLLAAAPLGVALALTVAATLAGGLIAMHRVATVASPVATATASLIGLTVLVPHLLVRTQAFSVLLFMVCVLLLERFATRAWMPVAYGLTMLVWTNVHGAFVIGLGLPLLFLAASLLDQVRSVPATVSRRRQASGIGLAAALGVIATLANPAGTDLLVYAVDLSANPVVRSVSTEWQPAYPWTPIAMPFWGFLALFIALRSWRGATTAEIMVVSALLVVGIASVRSIPWPTLAMLPLLAIAIDRQRARLPALRRALGGLHSPFSSGRARSTALIAMVVIIGFQVIRPGLPPALARLETSAPNELVDALESRIPPGAVDRVFNEQRWGGYLTYRLHGRALTYLDGRLEIAAPEVWRRYYEILGGTDGVALIGELGVDWVLLGAENARLLDDLREHGFQLIARSSAGELLRAPQN
jgi:hypothetical protein